MCVCVRAHARQVLLWSMRSTWWPDRLPHPPSSFLSRSPCLLHGLRLFPVSSRVAVQTTVGVLRTHRVVKARGNRAPDQKRGASFSQKSDPASARVCISVCCCCTTRSYHSHHQKNICARVSLLTPRLHKCGLSTRETNRGGGKTTACFFKDHLTATALADPRGRQTRCLGGGGDLGWMGAQGSIEGSEGRDGGRRARRKPGGTRQRDKDRRPPCMHARPYDC